MDTATLVDEQIAEGERFVDHLKQGGFDVAVAFWVLTSEEGLWHLYIASRVVCVDGLAGAYKKVYRELSHCQFRSIARSDIKLIESQNPIAVDAIANRNATAPTRYYGRKLGSMIVDEAYIYQN